MGSGERIRRRWSPSTYPTIETRIHSQLGISFLNLPFLSVCFEILFSFQHSRGADGYDQEGGELRRDEIQIPIHLSRHASRASVVSVSSSKIIWLMILCFSQSILKEKNSYWYVIPTFHDIIIYINNFLFVALSWCWRMGWGRRRIQRRGDQSAHPTIETCFQSQCGMYNYTFA